MEMVKAVLNGEFEMILPKNRADRPEWYTEEGWEKKRLKSMHKEIFGQLVFEAKKPIVFYIGAEMGEMAALCQMWGAKVVLFEPNPKAWASIKRIWEANHLEKPLGLFSGFASDRTRLPIHEDFKNLLQIGDDGWPVCSSEEIIEAHGFKELDKEADYFPQIKIDDLVDADTIPNGITLDVEGAEGKVLRGAEQTLRKYHPKIWLSGHPEFLHDNFKGGGGFEYLRELRDWLKKDLGYKEELLDFDHEVHLFYSYQ